MEALGIIALATLIEGTITYVFGESADSDTKPWLRYVSLGFGVVAACAYQVDILAAAGLVSPWAFVGWIASGLIIGRGANYLNDILSLIKRQ